MQSQRQFPLGRKLFIVMAILATFICISTLYQYQHQISESVRFASSIRNLQPSTILFAIFNNSVTKSAKYGDGNAKCDLEFQTWHFKIKNPDRVRGIRQAGKANGLGDLQMYVVPQMSCSTMVRVGGIGDGGKWVCNPWRVPSGCVIYSFGVNGDVSFEEDMHNITDHRCKFYSVDKGPQSAHLFEPFNGTFIQASIAGRSDWDDERKNGTMSITYLMRRFSHTRIDILKMDIEGWEFDSLDGFFKEAKITESQSNVCQLLVEFHFSNNRLATWTEMFEQLERLGFRMFSKEANTYCTNCFEFSFIHLSCFVKYGLNQDSIFDTLSG